MKKIITVIALTVSFGAAQAQSWQEVAKTWGGESMLVDLQSFRKEDGRFVMVQGALKKPFEPIEAHSWRKIYDCRGKNWWTPGYSDSKIDVYPTNTIQAATYNFVCERAFGPNGFVPVK